MTRGSPASPVICPTVPALMFLSGNPNWSRFASFAVTALTRSGYVYKSSANHDPDGSSNGFSIILRRN